MIVDQTVLDVISNGTTATKRSAVTDGVKLWPNGVVPYVISTHLCKISRRDYSSKLLQS